MPKKCDRKPTVRVAMDSVSGKLETTALTPVQLAFEVVVRCIDGQMVRLTNAECETLARKLLDRIKLMLPHEGGHRGT